MATSKYQKDSEGNSILGTQYGIQVTRPWSKEMYEHNEVIADKMKSIMSELIEKNKKNETKLRLIGKAIMAYSFGTGYDTEDIYNECVQELERVQNHWLHSNTWPDLVSAKLVEELEVGMIGYDKI